MKTLLSPQLPHRWFASLTALGLCLAPAISYGQNNEDPATSDAGTKVSPASEGNTAAEPEASKENSDRQPASLKKRKKDENSAQKTPLTFVGTASTLPENVLRFRYVFRDATGDFGYDADGNKTEGFDAVIHGQGFVLEYGLTPKISLQFLGQMVSTNEVVLNAEKFKKNPLFKNNKNTFLSSSIPGLIKAGLCSDAADCQTKIASGLSLPTPQDATLPSGETFIIPTGRPIDDVANSLVLNAARPLEGKTGVSDTTLGVLYNVTSTQTQLFSVGLGLRLPTGDADVPSAYRATGSGFNSLGLFLAYDYRPQSWFMISLTNQSEYHLNKINKKRSSVIDNSSFNAATPVDGIPNEETYERKGVSNAPSVNFKYSWSLISSALNPLTTDLFYGKVIDAEYYLGGRSQGPAAELTKASLGFTWDGINMTPRLPFYVTVSREVPLSGKNQTIAVASTLMTLALYYKF